MTDDSPDTAGIDAEIDRLYKLPLGEFVDARNELAGSLRRTDRALSAHVKKLPRPSLSAWAINSVYWAAPEEFDELLRIGEELRVLQQKALRGTLDADAVRAQQEAQGARDRAIAALARRTEKLLTESGHAPNHALMRRVVTTLEAVASYGRSAAAPPLGRLAADVPAPGFEILSDLAGGEMPERPASRRVARQQAFAPRRPFGRAKPADAPAGPAAPEATPKAMIDTTSDVTPEAAIGAMIDATTNAPVKGRSAVHSLDTHSDTPAAAGSHEERAAAPEAQARDARDEQPVPLAAGGRPQMRVIRGEGGSAQPRSGTQAGGVVPSPITPLIGRDRGHAHSAAKGSRPGREPGRPSGDEEHDEREQARRQAMLVVAEARAAVEACHRALIEAKMLEQQMRDRAREAEREVAMAETKLKIAKELREQALRETEEAKSTTDAAKSALDNAEAVLGAAQKELAGVL